MNMKIAKIIIYLKVFKNSLILFITILSICLKQMTWNWIVVLMFLQHFITILFLFINVFNRSSFDKFDEWTLSVNETRLLSNVGSNVPVQFQNVINFFPEGHPGRQVRGTIQGCIWWSAETIWIRNRGGWGGCKCWSWWWNACGGVCEWRRVWK